MQKDLLFRWKMNRRFRPLKHQQKIKKENEIAEQKGLPSSVETKAKQALVFALSQIGAFKRALKGGE